jgi:tetratricopeptide (TPR) repeat protein
MAAARRAAIARLARSPGPVEISAFHGPDVQHAGEPGDANHVATQTSVAQVLAKFRLTLTTMSIVTPQSIPSTPYHDSMLDDVREAAKEPNNSIATIAALVRAAIDVRSAYRIYGQMHVRGNEASEPFGITVHIIVRAGGAGTVHTLWDDDWDTLAVRAAHAVGAFVLPRSKLAHRPPWRAWHGHVIPHDLFHHVQRAATLKAERRYEEAAGALHDALKIDPQNPFLRIELAQVQEQMGLDLDALATYSDVIAVEAWYDRGLWRRLREMLADDTTGSAPSVFARSPHGPEAVLIARYRLVTRLVAANELSHQWVGADTGAARNRRRARELVALRRRTSIWLESYYRRFKEKQGLIVTTPQGSSGGAAELSTIAGDRRMMRYFLRFVGDWEVKQLVKDYRWIAGRRRLNMPATQTAIAVMLVWAPIQLAWARSRIDSEVWQMRAGRSATNRNESIESAARIAQQIDQHIKRKPRFLREWQEHYNAACVFAVALPAAKHGESDPSARRKQKTIAMMAVRHLEMAVSASDSGFVGTYAQWLATGDEDLGRLRSTVQFVDFLDRYLPNDRPRVPRPRRLLHLLMSLHTINLLREYAECRASFWSRGTTDQIDELAREPHVRRLALDYAKDDLDWLTRLELIQEAHTFARRQALVPINTTFPQFQDEPSISGYLKASILPNFDRSFTDRYFHRVIDCRSDDWSALEDYLERWANTHSGAMSTATAESCSRFWRTVASYLKASADTELAPAPSDTNTDELTQLERIAPTAHLDLLRW